MGRDAPLPPKEIHSDDDNASIHKVNSLSPKEQGIRPQSARTPSPPVGKNEQGFFAPNKLKKKKSKGDESKNKVKTPKLKRKGSDKGNAKKIKVKKTDDK